LPRECFIKHIIDGKIKGKRRGGRRSRELLDALKERRRDWSFKEEALDHTLWKTRVRRGYGFVIKKTAERANVLIILYLLFLGCLLEIFLKYIYELVIKAHSK
jgi:hypothetical protein